MKRQNIILSILLACTVLSAAILVMIEIELKQKIDILNDMAASCEETAEEETDPVLICEDSMIESVDRLPVSISIGEEGYYSTYAGVDFQYWDGRLSLIVIKDPTLLAFQVSEKWEGGAMIYNGADIEEIIEDLKAMNDPSLQGIIETLERGLLLTHAST